jgi:hypothetical protein
MLGYFGSASGVFGGPMRIEVGAITRTSAIVDVDDDDIGDVVVLGDPGDGTSVLVVVRGLGDGSFAPPVILPVRGTGGSPVVAFSIGDVDRDGTNDAVLSVDGGAEPPMVAYGRPEAPGFADPVPWAEIAPARGAALRDLDDDGEPELLVRPGASAELTVYERAGGAYELAAATDLAGAADGLLETGRIDGDEHVDIAAYTPGGTTIELWRGEDFRWEPTTEVELDFPVQQLVLADIDDDGAADIVAGTFEAGSITVVRATP